VIGSLIERAIVGKNHETRAPFQSLPNVKGWKNAFPACLMGRFNDSSIAGKGSGNGYRAVSEGRVRHPFDSYQEFRNRNMEETSIHGSERPMIHLAESLGVFP
jgi:hypothetical protein